MRIKTGQHAAYGIVEHFAVFDILDIVVLDATEDLGKDPKFGHWRDTHVRIEGPAVLKAQVSFLEDWYWATGDRLEVNWHPVPSADRDIPVLILPSGPADELETASLMFAHAINSAMERIWIASPYFVPDEAVVTAPTQDAIVPTVHVKLPPAASVVPCDGVNVPCVNPTGHVSDSVTRSAFEGPLLVTTMSY